MNRFRMRLVAGLLGAGALVAMPHPAHAAKEIGVGVTYDPRVPLGSFRDFVPDIAFGGVQMKWDYFPLDSLSIGLEVQYQLFQRGTRTSTSAIPNGAITAPTFRDVSIWSFLPTVRWYSSNGALRPYASLGAGFSAAGYAVLVSDVSQRSSGHAFIIQPSLGVLWRFADRTERPKEGEPARKPLDSLFGLTASVAYAYTTTDVPGADNINYAGIQIGIYAKP